MNMFQCCLVSIGRVEGKGKGEMLKLNYSIKNKNKKETDSPYHVSYLLSIAPQLGWRLTNPFSVLEWGLASSQAVDLCCECVSAAVLSCPEDPALVLSDFWLLNLSSFSSAVVPGPWGASVIEKHAEHPIDSHSSYFEQLWITALVIIYYINLSDEVWGARVCTYLKVPKEATDPQSWLCVWLWSCELHWSWLLWKSRKRS